MLTNSRHIHFFSIFVLYDLYQCEFPLQSSALLIFLVFCAVCFLVVFVFVCLRSVLCSQCFLCLWIIYSRLPLRGSLTFINIDIPHDIRVLRGKTLTKKTKKMSNIKQPVLTEHYRI
jgi:hypothetical protein